jgi:hypothetical protein
MNVIRELGDRLIGGVLPYVPKPERVVHTFDGTTYTIELVWFRRRFTASYHTPRHPLSVRWENTRALADQILRRHSAGEPIVQVGDVLPSHLRSAPYLVTRCRDAQHDEWRRAVGDECYPRDDITGELNTSQAYEWVQENHRDGRPAEISGHATDEGVLEHHPVTVLEIRQDVPA